MYSIFSLTAKLINTVGSALGETPCCLVMLYVGLCIYCISILDKGNGRAYLGSVLGISQHVQVGIGIGIGEGIN